MNHKRHLQQQIDHQVKRIKKARREQPTILAQSLYLGTLGLVLILPVIGGAYLGLWLDSMTDGYSMRWTISLLLLGLLLGCVNVYLLIKEQG